MPYRRRRELRGGRRHVLDGRGEGADRRHRRARDPSAALRRGSAAGRGGDDAVAGLLNAGPVTLAAGDRDEDRYGRKLRVVERGGQSLGMTLVSEGLAREWEGARTASC